MSSRPSQLRNRARQISVRVRSSASKLEPCRGIGRVFASLTLDLILLQLFTGLALGSVYILVAVGLSLIFGMLTVVNFAHGAFYMLGAYVGVYLILLGGNFWLCLIIVPIAVGILGLGIERTLIRPLYG